MQRELKRLYFLNDLHFKIALTGCANDCTKARMHDFGIIGMTEPQYDPNHCVSCGACVKGCDKLSVDALKMENYRIVRNEENVWDGVCVKKMSGPEHGPEEKCTSSIDIYGRTGKIGKSNVWGEDF